MGKERPWATLTAREQDLRVAHVLGWTGAEEETYSPHAAWVWRDAAGMKQRHEGPLVSSHSIARLVEDEIGRRGLQEQYIVALSDVKMAVSERAAPGLWYMTTQALWSLVRATPEQRCEAACAVLQELA